MEFTVGAVNIGKYISEMSVNISDLDSESSSRNALGQMMRDRIRGGKDALRKINVKCRPLNNGEMKSVMEVISTQAFFFVTYPDPLTGGNRRAEFYVGDRSVPVYRAVDGKFLWSNLTFNLVEK